jgi:plastocyanin
MQRSMRAIYAFALWVSAAPALSAPFTVTVRGVDGRPLPGAVVQLRTAHMPSPSTRLRGPFVMAQQNIAFVPHVLIVPVGAAVAFLNRDAVRHHVYSFSTPKRFELKLYGKDESRAVTFDKPGIVALGCNIHDQMTGFIIVADTPYAVQAGPDGRATLDVPAGGATIDVWHPSIRTPANIYRQPLAVSGSGAVVQVKK